MPVRILHLEDEDLDARLASAKIKAEIKGCEIVRATDKESFEGLLGKQKFDAFLVDFALPGYDGMAALKAVRNLDPIVPFIILSGTIGESRAIESLKVGATDFVLKDELSRLASVIRRALREAAEKAALAERDEMFFNLSEESMAGIYIIREGRYFYANQAFANIFGYSREEIMSMDYLDIIHPDFKEYVRENIKKQLDGEIASVHYQAKGIKKDGGVIDVEKIGTMVVLRAGPAIIGTCLDVTEKVKAEAQALHVQKLESLRVLAGGIAHDLNNLMVAVMGNAGLALWALPAGSPAREFVAAIENAAEKVKGFSKQILSFTSKAAMQREPVQLNQVVEDTAHFLIGSISKTASLEYSLFEGLPAIVAEPQNMQQIVMNLVINASDAIGDNEGTIKVSTGKIRPDRKYLDGLHPAGLPDGEYVYVEVSDTGCGMSPEIRGRIFEPFFTTKFTGRGIGLAAVFGIVSAHGGAIALESEEGCGATLRVLLPVPEKPVEVATAKPVSEDVWNGKGSILIVDDERDSLLMAKKALEGAGYSVLTADDGFEAIRIYRKNSDSISAVILDLIMPHVRGDEAAKEIRRIRDDANILLLSGYHEIDLTELTGGQGKTGILEKPYRITKLLGAVQGILEA